MPETYTDVACTVCGCVCDDLTVTTDGGRVVRADRACRLAEPWLLAQTATPATDPAVDGRPAVWADAYERAAGLLAAARAPLVYGLARTGTAGARAAAALADRLGATLDVAGGHAAAVAVQQVGEATCTLGEVRQRADLVVFWGCDPAATHPRLVERYCPPRPGRSVVTVGGPDAAVPVSPDRQWEAVWALRLLVAGAEPRPGCDAGASLDALRSLAGRMAGCRCGVVFFGDGLTAGPLGHRTAEALFQLVADLNDRTRFYARHLAGCGGASGADSVLAWQTGYPFGVDLAAGHPRSHPGDTTGPDVLARGEADACVLVGSHGVGGLPAAALDHLRRVPVVVLDPPGVEPPVPAAVRFPTSTFGVHQPGTAHRLDGVSIPLRVLLPSALPGEGEVLGELLRLL